MAYEKRHTIETVILVGQRSRYYIRITEQCSGVVQKYTKQDGGSEIKSKRAGYPQAKWKESDLIQRTIESAGGMETWSHEYIWFLKPLIAV